ncbi:NAD(P)/FAD-dependent oxidoreductase [Pseudonocardiaceae bacterium YIM PH 21723]|nr:NAD(P)/FAD-dependent oxidoreductase [Pseudonocardiaceae bacterium YIM PH 21723]
MDEFEVVVIGGGAAGLNAALVLGRARRRVAVVDGGAPRNAPAEHMHGYLSRDGQSPAELVKLGREEIAGYGVTLIEDQVAAVTAGFQLRLASGRTLNARKLIVATGLVDGLPDIPGMAERWGRDVLHCPYCHGYEVADQPLGVLGAGPLSVHVALLVRQWTDDLVFFSHTYELSDVDRARLRARDIRVEPGEVTGLAVDGDRLQAVKLADRRAVTRSALFVKGELTPRDEVLTALGCVRGEHGFVPVDGDGRTSVPGLYAVGNVVNPKAFVITAAAMGATAAVAVNGELVEEAVLEGMSR